MCSRQPQRHPGPCRRPSGFVRGYLTLDPKRASVVRAAGDRSALREGEVHVWTAELCASRERVDDFVLSLSPGETLRASKYVFERDRENFILCRGMLRALLGAYLAVPGPAVEISTDLRGKPELARHLRGSDLRFNLSHSHGLAIFAFTRGKEVGVDAELIRQDIEAEEIAQRYFSDDERRELGRLGDAERTSGFFACWTRKEAYLKARGDGLGAALDSFSVTLTPAQPVLLRSEDAHRWSIYSFELAKGWATALVVEGVPNRIVLGQVP
jgi:4'-phosphopantetheinyl transferase